MKKKKAKKPKTIPLKVHFWRSATPGTAIKLASASFVVLVRKNPKKKAGHPALWRELNKILKKHKL